MTTPADVVQSFGATFHVCAAAATSIARAVAPVLRSGSAMWRMLVLPPVDIECDVGS